jgi:2-phosphosulfolactate phosphatase
MRIHHATLDDCATARGAVVVIDVIRAFTTAAHAFAARAREIVLVAGVEEAFDLRAQIPGALLMGEVGGFPPPGFDFGNSPVALNGADLRDRVLIQRTGAGTQAAVRCAHASTLLLASFPCATATVRQLRAQAPTEITLVASGPEGEDVACALYLEALLRDQLPDPAWLAQARAAGLRRLMEPGIEATTTAAQRDGFRADIECCVALDAFDFAIAATLCDGLLVARRAPDLVPVR